MHILGLVIHRSIKKEKKWQKQKKNNNNNTHRSSQEIWTRAWRRLQVIALLRYMTKLQHRCWGGSIIIEYFVKRLDNILYTNPMIG